MTPIAPLGGRAAVSPLRLLLSLDLAFVLAHLVNAWLLSTPWPMLSLEQDRSLSEWAQYVKFGAMALLLLATAAWQRRWHALSWVPLMGFLLLDDAFSVHERYGWLASVRLELPAWLGLSGQDIGQLLVSGVSGLMLFSPIALGWVLGDTAFRRQSEGLAWRFGLLGFFGVFVDAAHNWTRPWPALDFAVGVLEDGGEMLAASLMLAFVWAMAIAARNAATRRSTP